MQVKVSNVRYNVYGTIDCVAEHPLYGNIPYTVPAEPENEFDEAVIKAVEGIVPAPAPAVVVTGEAVNAERDRRIEQGKTFALSTGKQISLRGDNTTKENLQALAFAASMRVAQGQGAVITLFRDNTDYVYELTQLEIIELWSRSAEFVSKMFQAGWFIKDAPSIPKDYTADKYWKDA